MIEEDLTFAAAGPSSPKPNPKRLKFITVPTPASATVEDMKGHRSSHGVWLRLTPASATIKHKGGLGGVACWFRHRSLALYCTVQLLLASNLGARALHPLKFLNNPLAIPNRE